MNIKGYRARERAAKERRERRLVSPEIRAQRAAMLEKQQKIAAEAEAARFETPAQLAAKEVAAKEALAKAAQEAAEKAEREAAQKAEDEAAAKKSKSKKADKTEA